MGPPSAPVPWEEVPAVIPAPSGPATISTVSPSQVKVRYGTALPSRAPPLGIWYSWKVSGAPSAGGWMPPVHCLTTS